MTQSSILNAAVAVTVGNLAVQIANLGRDIAFATVFGSNLTVDSFFLATMVPIFLVTVGAGAYRSTIVPVLERIALSKGSSAKQRIVARAMRANVVVLVSVCGLLALCVPGYATMLAGRLPDPAGHLIAVFTWATLPMFFLSCFASLADGPLQTQGRFFFPSASRAGLPIGIAVGAIALGDRYGVFGACIGGLIGASLQLLVILRLLGKDGFLHPAGALPDDDTTVSIRRQFLFLSASVSIQYVSPIIDQWMASLLGPGSVSALSYANRLAIGAGSIMAGAIGPVLLPLFSRVIAKADKRTLDTYYFSAARLTFWGGLLLAGLLWLFAEPAIALLYERGRFVRQDTQTVSHVLTYLALQFPFFLPGVVAATLISAAGHNRFFLPLTISTAIVNASGNLILMQWYGLAGIAIATCVTYLLSCIAMNAYLYKKRLISFPRGLAWEVAAAIATAVFLAVTIFTLNMKPALLPTWSQLGVSGLSVCIYCAVAYYFMKPIITGLTRGASSSST